MKKLLSTLLVIVLMTALLSVNVFAAKDPVWKKYMSKTYEERTEDGEKVYAIGGLQYSYSTPGLEIGSLIKEKANSESITLTISFDARIDYVDDDDPIEVQLDAIFRGGGLSDALKDKETMKDVWDENYEGSFFKYVSGNLMAYGFKGSKITLDEEWQTITFEFELYNEDLGIGLFDEWYFCFQNYNPIDVIEYLEFKNTVVTVTGEGEAPAKTPTPAKTPEATKAPAADATPAPATAAPATTPAPAGDNDAEATRPVITKNPEKTIAPDSALATLIANSCNCDQNANAQNACTCNQTLPIIAIALSAVALVASLLAVALVIRKKK